MRSIPILSVTLFWRGLRTPRESRVPSSSHYGPIGGFSPIAQCSRSRSIPICAPETAVTETKRLRPGMPAVACPVPGGALLRDFYLNGRGAGVRPDLQKRVGRILDALNQARALTDLAFPGFGLHPLRRTPKRCALSVNGPWRITFE